MDVMTIVYAFFVFLVTTCIGSFLNVVIYRLPNKMNLAFPASHCPKCNHELAWYDNIPLFSFIFLKGKCRYCKEKISPRYFIVELLTGVISTYIFLRFGISFRSLFGIIIFLILIPVAFIDIEHLMIPDIFQIILLGIGILSIFFNPIESEYINIDWKSRLIGAGIFLVFFIIIILIELLLKKEFLGGGDLKLLFVISFSLGYELTLLSLAIASIIGSIIELIFLKRKKKKIKELNEKDDLSEVEEDKIKGRFPFGPYLAIGIMIAYIFGVELLNWWLSMIC